MKYRKFLNKDVGQVFNEYPLAVKEKLLSVREKIFEVAEESDEVGKVEEVLKWENPSYLTLSPKSGTTIRLSNLRSESSKYALSVHCQTSLIAEFKEIYPEQRYDGNRSIIFDVNENLPNDLIRHFILLALTYHYRKKRGIGI